VRDSVVIR